MAVGGEDIPASWFIRMLVDRLRERKAKRNAAWPGIKDLDELRRLQGRALELDEIVTLINETIEKVSVSDDEKD